MRGAIQQSLSSVERERLPFFVRYYHDDDEDSDLLHHDIGVGAFSSIDNMSVGFSLYCYTFNFDSFQDDDDEISSSNNCSERRGV